MTEASPPDGSASAAPTSASEELRQWLARFPSVPHADRADALLPSGDGAALNQRRSSDRNALEQERADLAAQVQELELHARTLATEAQRIVQERQWLAREREELRSERVALDGIRRQLATPSHAGKRVEVAVPAEPVKHNEAATASGKGGRRRRR